MSIYTTFENGTEAQIFWSRFQQSYLAVVTLSGLNVSHTPLTIDHRWPPLTVDRWPLTGHPGVAAEWSLLARTPRQKARQHSRTQCRVEPFAFLLHVEPTCFPSSPQPDCSTGLLGYGTPTCRQDDIFWDVRNSGYPQQQLAAPCPNAPPRPPPRPVASPPSPSE
jgi:hypothetical protein